MTLSTDGLTCVESYSAFNVKLSKKCLPPQPSRSSNIQIFVKFENKLLPSANPAPFPSKQELWHLKGPNSPHPHTIQIKGQNSRSVDLFPY